MQELILKGLDEKIYYYESSCGLPVYMWVNDKISSMYASLSVKYGSIHTKFKVGKDVFCVPNGVAHFLEHVKFNMSDGKTAHDEFYKIGGDANAFTTFDYTSYIVFATDKKNENLNLLLDFVFNPYFTKRCVNKEKGIIAEEAKMGMDDPYNVIFFHSLGNVLLKSKYRNTITGSVSDVKNISLEDLKLVYDVFYHPKNMFLTVTGNFNPYEVANLVEENLSKKEFKEYLNPLVIKEVESKKIKEKYKEEYVNLATSKIKVACKMEMAKFKNYSKLMLKVLADFILSMNFGATSSFNDELTEMGLIQNMSFTSDIYDDIFLISVSLTSNYKDEVIKRVKNKFKNLDVSDNDFKRKKNSAIATLILDYEDVEYVSYRIQNDVLNNGGIVTNLKELLEGVTLDNLKELIKLFDLGNLQVSVFLPKENQKN